MEVRDDGEEWFRRESLDPIFENREHHAVRIVRKKDVDELINVVAVSVPASLYFLPDCEHFVIIVVG